MFRDVDINSDFLFGTVVEKDYKKRQTVKLALKTEIFDWNIFIGVYINSNFLFGTVVEKDYKKRQTVKLALKTEIFDWNIFIGVYILGCSDELLE